jgi:hypothetical protein
MLLVFLTSESRAEESSYMPDSPLIYALAGLLIIDIGVSLSNGFSLINDRPNKINGYFGIVTGVISLGLVTANLLVEENEDLRNNYALVMGTAGATSLILGTMNVRRSGNTQEAPIDESRIKFYPTIARDIGQKYKIGININILF